jgi:hypothetical protein
MIGLIKNGINGFIQGVEVLVFTASGEVWFNFV